MEQLFQSALPLICGLVVFGVTRLIYNRLLKEEQERTSLLKRYRDLRLAGARLGDEEETEDGT